MIKNVMQAVTGYAQAKEQAKSTYDQAVDYIKQNYIEGSAMYNEVMKTIRSTYDQAVKPLEDNYYNAVNTDFAGVKKSIREIVTKPPTNEVLNLVNVIKSGTVNDEEKQMILEHYKSNYMDSKILHNAFGEHFVTVEDLMQSIEDLEEEVVKYPHYYKEGHFTARVLENDSWIQKVDKLTDEFIEAYTDNAKGGE